MKHTTGEWIVNNLSLNESAFEVLTSRPMENGLNGCIAYIKCSNYTIKGQAEANANLIAASPLLLQMVIDLKNCIKRLTQDDVTQFDRDLEDNWEGEAHELLTKVCPDYYQNANENN